MRNLKYNKVGPVQVATAIAVAARSETDARKIRDRLLGPDTPAILYGKAKVGGLVVLGGTLLALAGCPENRDVDSPPDAGTADSRRVADGAGTPDAVVTEDGGAKVHCDSAKLNAVANGVVFVVADARGVKQTRSVDAINEEEISLPFDGREVAFTLRSEGSAYVATSTGTEPVRVGGSVVKGQVQFRIGTNQAKVLGVNIPPLTPSQARLAGFPVTNSPQPFTQSVNVEGMVSMKQEPPEAGHFAQPEGFAGARTLNQVRRSGVLVGAIGVKRTGRDGIVAEVFDGTEQRPRGVFVGLNSVPFNGFNVVFSAYDSSATTNEMTAAGEPCVENRARVIVEHRTTTTSETLYSYRTDGALPKGTRLPLSGSGQWLVFNPLKDVAGNDRVEALVGPYNPDTPVDASKAVWRGVLGKGNTVIKLGPNEYPVMFDGTEKVIRVPSESTDGGLRAADSG